MLALSTLSRSLRAPAEFTEAKNLVGGHVDCFESRRREALLKSCSLVRLENHKRFPILSIALMGPGQFWLRHFTGGKIECASRMLEFIFGAICELLSLAIVR